MVLPKHSQREIEALIQQGIAEQQALNPDLCNVPQPLTDEEFAQELAEGKEIERIWDELDQQLPDRPRVSAADLIIDDRGE